MKKIGITTELAADIKEDLIKKYNIGVVAFHTDIKENIFKKMRETGECIKTSQPSMAVYLEMFKKKLEEFEKIIHITTSSRVSGAFNSANQAKKFLGENAKRVLILDSEKSSAAQGLLVLKTQEDVDLGLSLKEILNNFKERVKNTFVFFMYDEPKWLKAGGRFPKIAQIGLQKIKDFNVSLVLREKGGVIRPVAFKKNATNLVDPLFDEFKKFTKGVEKKINVVITHGDDMIQANELRKKLETLKNVKVLYIKLLDIVLGAHIGPNALVINFEYD